MRVVIKSLEHLAGLEVQLLRQFRTHQARGLLVTVEPYHPPRTSAQNSLIHVLIADLADALGYAERTEFKEALKQEYWPRKTIQLVNGSVAVPKSTAELSREEATAVIEKLHYLAAEAGVQLRR